MTQTLLEYVETHKLEHATVRRVIEMLPEDDAELDKLIGSLVEEGHLMGFIFVITAALASDRDLSADHLRECVAMMPNGEYLSRTFWRMKGDKVTLLTQALITQTAPHSIHLHGLLVIAAWCRTHEGGVLPKGYLADVRKIFRVKMSREEDRGLAVALAYYLDDPDVIAVAVESHGHFLKKEDVKVSSRKYAEALIACYPNSIMSLVSEGNNLLAVGTHIRRVLPKMSRNDPCHCGSGLKYKRCCHEKDQQRARFPSAVAGLTQAELDREPEPYLTVEEVKYMSRPRLKRLDPRKLPEDVLTWYLFTLSVHGLFTKVAEAFEKLGWRAHLEDYEQSWLNALTFACWSGDTAGMEQIIRARYPDGQVPEGILKPELELMRLSPDPAAYQARLEMISEELLRTQDPERQGLLGHALLNVMTPATSLLMAQGLLPVMAKSEVHSLHRQMQTFRDKLLLPAEDPFAEILERRFSEAAAKSQGKEAENLRETNDRLQVKSSELRDAKEKLERLHRELRLKEKAEHRSAAKETTAPSCAELEALRHLREKVEAQQGIINGHIQERAQMRLDMADAFSELEEHRKQQQPLQHTSEARDNHEEEALLQPASLGNKQPLRLIEYPKKFHETLNALPTQVSRAAQILLGRLAGGEPSAFVGIVALRAGPDTLRMRVGSDHRLIFRLHPMTLEVVALINRRDLDRWVKACLL